MKENNSKLQRFPADFQLLMSCVESNQENFNFLIRLMRRNVVIPFIGAGFSKNFKYPLWGEFLDEQANIHHLPEIGTAKKNHEYERAATLLEEHLGGSMEYTLMQSFGDHIYKAHSHDGQLDCLPRIFRNLILTTNFDEVIEMLYAKVNGEHIEKLTPRNLQDVKLSHKRIACGEPTLIKLHGDVALRDFVLTEQAYNNVYGRSVLDIRLPLPSFLRDVLLSRIILFLGCSLEDDRTLQVIEQSQIDGSISFALLELPKETENKDTPWTPKLTKKIDALEVEIQEFTERKTFLNAHNIIPIWFPYQEYDALKIFLSMVESQISPEYKFSITGAQVRVENLFNNGKKLGREGNTEEAFRCYTNALEIIKTNPDAFVGKKRLDDMNKIKSFYDLNGYGFECKEIIKECIFLIRQIYSGDSVELAMYYHGIGYTYERYMYYRLKLKAMQRSQEILQKSIKKSGENVYTLNAAAWIYTSLAYAFEENNDIDNAGKWYKKAEELLSNHEQSLDDDEKAFIYNGLHRHYKQLEDNSKAIDVLEKALELRKKIYYSNNLSEDETREALNHIINTHSNKIRIYLHLNQLDEAEREYQTCKNEYSFIWNRPKYLLSAKRRIGTDYGDILVKNKEYEEAYKQYWRALRYRRYQHYIDDFLVADLYFKISESLKNIKERYEEAMEYMIQAYVVYEETIKSNYYIIEKNREEYMKKLSECLSSRDDETLKQRLSVQQEFFRFRHDKRLDNRQDELIKYFDL